MRYLGRLLNSCPESASSIDAAALIGKVSISHALEEILAVLFRLNPLLITGPRDGR